MRTRSAHHASISLRAPAHAGFDTDAINYAIKYKTKIKAKFFYCDQIKFNWSLYLNQEHQKSSI